MSTFDDCTRALKARGWRHDRDNEEFLDGDRVLEWQAVIGLVPGENLDWLASWQDDQHDR